MWLQSKGVWLQSKKGCGLRQSVEVVKEMWNDSLVPSLVPSFYRYFFMNSKKAGGGLGTRLLVE